MAQYYYVLKSKNGIKLFVNEKAFIACVKLHKKQNHKIKTGKILDGYIIWNKEEDK